VDAILKNREIRKSKMSPIADQCRITDVYNETAIVSHDTTRRLPGQKPLTADEVRGQVKANGGISQYNVVSNEEIALARTWWVKWQVKRV